MNNKNFIKGAFILIIFNLIGKIVGAVYRIPLANILGSEGIGEYQLVFPLYSLMLTISTSGIPVAISKLVSEFNSEGKFYDSKKLLKSSMLYLTILSVVCSAIVVLCSKFISNLQGNSDIYICYYGIAPAILFVGLISALRGYFQGNLSMTPTACSSLIEQVFKLGFGLFFAYKLLPFGSTYGVLGALIGISVSELFACIFLLFYYLFYSKNKKIEKTENSLSYRQLSKKLISIAVPITLGGLALPIASIVDSLLVVNLLKIIGYSSFDATSLLGLQAGIVEPIINVPIVVAISISASILPNISKQCVLKNDSQIKNLVEKAFQITLCVVLSCSICFFVFGRQILQFLYSSLTETELVISTKLLFLNSISLVFVSLVQVSAGILQGLGRHNQTVKSIIVGSVIKVVLTAALVVVKPLNIYGAAIAGIFGYMVAFLINYKTIKELTPARISNVYYGISVQQCFVCLFAFFANWLVNMAFGSNIALFVGGAVSVLVFALTYYIFFMIKDKSETATA